jgi:hypothetical protein
MRTGETVKELVVLDQAFRNAHLGADMIGLSANMLQRSLGGLNDMGGKTDGAFKRIGTSIAELKPLAYAQQLEVLSEGFAKLSNQADKVSVARAIFGRGGGSMLQLLGDPEALERAKQQTGELAGRIDQNARSAENLEKQWSGITAQIRTMWQAAATQVLPVLEDIAKVMGVVGGGAGGVGAFLGGASPALLGMAGVMAFDKADRMLFSLLTKMEEGSARSLVRGLSNGMGELTVFLPAALAGLIAGGIVAGILNAMADANVQEMLRDMHTVGDAMKGARDRAGKSGSLEENRAARSLTETEMAKLQLEKTVLEKRRDAAAAEAANSLPSTNPYAPGQRYSAPTNVFSDTDAKRLQDVKEIIGQQKLLIRDMEDPTKVAKTISENQLKAIKTSLDPLVADLPKLREEADKAELKVMDPRQRLDALQGRKAMLEGGLGQATGAGAEYDEARTLSLKKDIADLEAQILETKNQITEADNKITAEAKKQADDAQKRLLYGLETQRLQAQASGNTERAQQLKEEIEQKKAAYELSGLDLTLTKDRAAAEHQIWAEQEAQRKARETTQGQRIALENTLTGIRESITNLEADYTRTDADKWADRKAAIALEISTLQDAIKADQLAAQQARAAGHAGAAATFEGAAATKGQQLGSLQGEAGRLGPNPNDPFAQMRKSLIQLRNEWGTTAQQIGHGLSSVIGSGLQTVSSQITTAIVRTGDWRQAFANIGLAIEESVIGALVDMGVKYVATKIMMAITDKSVAAASTAALIPLAMATSAIWAGPATLATIASWGGAAAAAPFEIAMAMGLTQGMAIAGFETGGYTGEQGGIVHKREYVFSAPAVANLGGPAAVDAMHRAALRPAAAPAMAPLGSGGRQQAQNHYWFFDRAPFAEALAGDMTGIAHEVFNKRARTG